MQFSKDSAIDRFLRQGISLRGGGTSFQQGTGVNRLPKSGTRIPGSYSKLLQNARADYRKLLRAFIETSVKEGKTPGLAGTPKSGLTDFDGVTDTPSKQMQNKTGTPLGLRGREANRRKGGTIDRATARSAQTKDLPSPGERYQSKETRIDTTVAASKKEEDTDLTASEGRVVLSGKRGGRMLTMPAFRTSEDTARDAEAQEKISRRMAAAKKLQERRTPKKGSVFDAYNTPPEPTMTEPTKR